MRTTVIPAQITTVEDKIAGNLSLTQILLLLAPLFISTFIYTVLPVRLHLTLYKLPFMLVSLLVCSLLALRIKGKVILHWMIILTRYYFRPHLYLFDKNEPFLRDSELLLSTGNHQAVNKEEILQIEKVTDNKKVLVSDLVKMEELISNPESNLRFNFDRNGGLNVAFQKVKE